MFHDYTMFTGSGHVVGCMDVEKNNCVINVVSGGLTTRVSVINSV